MPDLPDLKHVLLSHNQKQCDLCGVALLLNVITLGLLFAWWCKHS